MKTSQFTNAATFSSLVGNVAGPQGFSYGRQLLGIALSYSLGLRMTLSELLKSSSTASDFTEKLKLHLLNLDRRRILQFEYEGFEALCNIRGVILAANHPSTLDAIGLLNQVPNLTCLMRASLMRNPIIRGAARMTGFIPNDIGASFIRQVEQRLKAGENLLIFPEGTRTAPGRALNSFKKGFALISTRNRFPIHTVLIERKTSYLSKNVSLFVPTELPITIRFKVGRIFLPQTNERPRQLILRLQNYFQNALELSENAILVRDKKLWHY